MNRIIAPSHKVIRVCIFAVAAVIITGCQHGQLIGRVDPAEGTAPKIGRPHEEIIERYSAGDSEYSGFYNNFEYKATLKNSEVREALLTRQATFYQWDHEQTATERDKAFQELSSEAQVFMSFFTPQRTNDNLADAKSIWRVYLDVGGSRYQGKIKKIKGNMAELQALYPYHTRWTTPYEVSFPVPMTAIEGQRSSLTITGPLGTRAVEFSAVR